MVIIFHLNNIKPSIDMFRRASNGQKQRDKCNVMMMINLLASKTREYT